MWSAEVSFILFICLTFQLPQAHQLFKRGEFQGPNQNKVQRIGVRLSKAEVQPSELKLARQNLAQLTERPGLALLCTGTVKIHTIVKLTIFCKKKPSRNLKLSLIYLKNSFIILVFNLFLALRLDQDCPIQRFNFMKPKEQKYFVTKLEFFCTINFIFD